MLKKLVYPKIKTLFLLIIMMIFLGCVPQSDILKNNQNISKVINIKVLDSLVSYRENPATYQKSVYSSFVPVYINSDGKREVYIPDIATRIEKSTILSLRAMKYNVFTNNEQKPDFVVIPFAYDIVLTERCSMIYGLYIFKNNKLIGIVKTENPINEEIVETRNGKEIDELDSASFLRFKENWGEELYHKLAFHIANSFFNNYNLSKDISKLIK